MLSINYFYCKYLTSVHCVQSTLSEMFVLAFTVTNTPVTIDIGYTVHAENAC